ncbi:hypothetical protein K439DRAFT_1346986, partial [Ramaria rubella]
TITVACQFIINLAARFQEHFPCQVDIITCLTTLIPKMHIRGHKDDCLYWFSFNSTPCVGRTHEESLETPWSENNQAGASTREMNAGHRQDTLNNLFSDWNWLKVQGMSAWNLPSQSP